MLDRAEIRASTVTLLTDATPAGKRVFASRIAPLVKPTYPLILVYTPEEDMEGGRGTPPSFEHRLTLVVDVRSHAGSIEDVSDPQSVEGALDGLCEAVLDRLLTTPEWVNQFERIASIKTRVIPQAQGSAPVLCAWIVITGTYSTSWDPKVPDSFATVRIGVDCIDPADPNLARPGPDGRPEAGAVFTIPS